MKIISTTNARKHISKLVKTVRETGAVVAIGKRNQPEVLLIKFPTEYNTQLDSITKVNASSKSFRFLENEPDLYSIEDRKKL